MNPPYDHETDPSGPLGPKMRAIRGTAQAIVGMIVALLALFSFDLPAEQVAPITAGIVALVGIVQNAYDQARITE